MLQTKTIQYYYNINKMRGVDLVSTIHIDDYNTRFIELLLFDHCDPFFVMGSEVIARFTTTEKVLISDRVPCTVTENNTILIPIDAAAVNSRACDLKIEVNITKDGDVLTLPFPLWVRVRGSVLDTAKVTESSKGTVPELLEKVKAELKRVGEGVDEYKVYEIVDAIFKGETIPTLTIDNKNRSGNYILYYIDSDDERHDIFNLSSILGAGQKGDKGDKGDSYTLTAADKQEIAEKAAEDITKTTVSMTVTYDDGTTETLNIVTGVN